METLDLFKDRRPYKVLLEVKGGKKEFKLPTEFTVEESERLLEMEIRVSKIVQEEVKNKTEEKEKLDVFFNNILEYILMLLQHYQPEIEMAELKKIVSRAEAVRIFEFFKRQRFTHLLGLDGSANDDVVKKKLKQPKAD